MRVEKMREEFEAWYAKRFSKDCDLNSAWAQERWEAWQASRAALVIELPKRVGYEHRYHEIDMSSMEPDQNPSADESFGLIREVEILQSIEAAGVKVKP